MNNSVLIINGSTRPNGNTDILLDRVISGAGDVNLKPALIELRKKDVSNCIGCYQCFNSSKCSFDDDMTKIRSLMEDSTLIVLASPLYWGSVTGLMKVFLDRLFFYYHPQTRPLISGKRAIILTPMNQNNVEFESQVLVEFYKRLLSCLGITIIDMFFYGGIMGKGEVMEKQEYLEGAYEIGSNMRNYIRG